MLLDALPFVILGLHFTDKWFLSLGRLFPTYVLTIAGSVSTVVYNVMLLSAMNGNHSSILLFSINSLWTVTMAVKGILRLIREAKTKHRQLTPIVSTACVKRG